MFGREYWWVCMNETSETAPGVWTAVKGGRSGPHELGQGLYWDAISGPFDFKYQACDEAARLNQGRKEKADG